MFIGLKYISEFLKFFYWHKQNSWHYHRRCRNRLRDDQWIFLMRLKLPQWLSQYELKHTKTHMYPFNTVAFHRRTVFNRNRSGIVNTAFFKGSDWHLAFGWKIRYYRFHCNWSKPKTLDTFVKNMNNNISSFDYPIFYSNVC